MRGARAGPLPAEERRLRRMRERPFAPPDPVAATDVVLALFLALAAFGLRWLGIGAPSLWADEGASLLFSGAEWRYLLTVLPGAETNPPGYYAILKLWTGVAGSAEAALRMPGAVAGALAVFALYFAAQRVFGRGAAIVAATVLALSAVQVAHAQEARAYPLVTLGFVLGLWLVHVWADALAEGRALGWRVPALAAVTAALPYLHYSGYFVAVVLLVYMLALLILRGLFTPRAAGALAGAALLVAVLAAPPVYWTLGHLGSADDPAGWLRSPTVWDAKWVLHEAFGAKHLSFAAPDWARARIPDDRAAKLFAPRRLAEISLLLLCLFGLVAALRERQRAVPALALAWLAAMALLFGVSQAKPVFLERTVIFAVPLVALIAGYAVMALRYTYLVFPAALGLFGFQAANLAGYYPTAEKENWRDVIAAMQAEHGPGVAVVLAAGPYLPPSVSSAPLLGHYWRGDAPGAVFALPAERAGRLTRVGVELSPGVTPLEGAALCPALGGFDRLLVLYRFPEQAGALDPALSALGSAALADRREGFVGFETRGGVSCAGAGAGASG